MASAPRYDEGACAESDGISLFPSCIQPRLLNLSHVRSILIRNIKVQERQREFPKTHFKDRNRENSIDIDFRERDWEHVRIRKGRSTHSLRLSITKNETEGGNDEAKVPVFAAQPEEVRKQVELQEYYNMAFFECFFTVSLFLNDNNPYFISRLFEPNVDVEEDLSLPFKSGPVTISLYLRQLEDDKWKLHNQVHLNFTMLVNLGDEYPLIERKLCDTENLLVLRMSDGCYYTMQNKRLNNEAVSILQSTFRKKMEDRSIHFNHLQNSCTFDQIMILNNYSRCLHDLKNTTRILIQRINAECSNEETRNRILETIDYKKSRVENYKELISAKQSINNDLGEKITELKNLRDVLKAKIQQLNQIRELQEKDCVENAEKLQLLVQSNEKLNSQIHKGKSDICKIIQFIFPIEPFKRKYNFSLFGISIPQALTPSRTLSLELKKEGIIPVYSTPDATIQKVAQLPKSKMDPINALFGYISLMILKLADILQVPIRYPIKYLGSNSYIVDPITSWNSSSGKNQSKIYPLFICQNITLAVKFTYALLLLSKNLEQLYEAENITKVEDTSLLTSLKIWLTCVEGYTDAQTYENERVIVEEEEPAGHDILKNLFSGDSNYHESSIYTTDRKSGGARRISNLSKQSNGSVITLASKRSSASGMSTSSLESGPNLVVSKYKDLKSSDERIKHIKRHLLKGSGKSV